ncbi:MAG: PadR family transcriptional regulator [Vicinamibacterales bacterium]|jgi:DNA-binding PadR family transcriptional regulator|nr:hypothetical protein [Acidobacteriota bacterium]MDP7293940.1 PadR family transcriptional regulator [Vicinamibacterales bacterium]MDP7473338.1 PadR family transcriptional regulator [Vicinamibacterales bacterium]MDP7670807.1 PadR family transcriptional regulator [Vicinamibacterales bacterium]HJO37814.1 PadR family transcriptional regulator [Vicinamibacterales bacterium]|tara:strand:- start:5192 stop:5755 length:564 start_codon:yes stop_codon:yes gene_type:complete
MSVRPLTTLTYALLGLIQQAPLSGYALMKTFQTTPMRQYSGSPGAVYPALRKLERGGLIRGAVERQGSLRPRRVYHLTSRGREALRRWLSPPVTVEDAALRERELMLRFALMDSLLPPAQVDRFLKTMAASIDDYVESIAPFMDAAGMTSHATLALESGLEGLRGRAAWARRARRRLGNRRRGRKAR